jgi:hypothetical protein
MTIHKFNYVVNRLCNERNVHVIIEIFGIYVGGSAAGSNPCATYFIIAARRVCNHLLCCL